MLAMELLEIAFELQPTRAAVLSDIGRTPFAEDELRHGSEYALPRWFVETLRSLGKVDVIEEVPVYSRILKVKFAHSTASRQSLPPISEFFYVSSRKELERAMEQAQRNLDLETLTRISKAVKAFSDIANRRISAIIKAVSLGGYAAIERGLSYEEKLLATALSKILSRWREEFLQVKEGEKP